MRPLVRRVAAVPPQPGPASVPGPRLPSPSRRVGGLDGIRALAIALVLIDHAAAGHFEGGGVGVAVFFVLSGYLITTLLVRERARTGSVGLGLFYLRRALRLWPALLVMLGVTVLAGASAKAAAAAGLYLTDLLNVIGRSVEPYGHTWSLGVEEQFYLLWPLCLIVLLRCSGRTQVAVLTLGSAFSVLGCAVWTAHSVATTGAVGLGVFSPLWQGHGLLIGCLLALAGGRLVVRRPIAVALVGAGAVFAVAIAASVTVGLHIAVVWNVLAELAAVILVVAVRTSDRTPFSWAWAQWVGRRSYAIYLWHLPLIILCREHHTWSPATLGIAGSLVAAELSARFVEAPFLRMKDRLHPAARPAPVAVPS
jgi:peptidoglycan/LPS O-acetylase OafA/YrhL